jgi:hypothetical protein
MTDVTEATHLPPTGDTSRPRLLGSDHRHGRRALARPRMPKQGGPRWWQAARHESRGGGMDVFLQRHLALSS